MTDRSHSCPPGGFAAGPDFVAGDPLGAGPRPRQPGGSEDRSDGHHDPTGAQPRRLGCSVGGAVQGVGFRPFVYRLAGELSLTGTVYNDAHGVAIEVQGTAETIDDFVRRLHLEQPAAARIDAVTRSWLECRDDESEFRILASVGGTAATTTVLADLAMCDACRVELTDPADRRYRYPFANCTDCGPRFSIIDGVPYDRSRTSMGSFPMCDECIAEYNDPSDRRFHAQPVACAACGPQVCLRDADGAALARGDEALAGVAAALRAGRIVAAKGLGGFHLLVRADDEKAVARLRMRKGRPDKPLAVMVADLAAARADCEVPEVAAALLEGSGAPIVILTRRSPGRAAQIATNVAPNSPTLGLMLPYTPLHHLIVTDVALPLVATSGNLSGEPMCTDGDEALRRLAGIADLFLDHDRPIRRHVDDSVFHLTAGHAQPLRRSRGVAPLPVKLPASAVDILAVGAQLKNTVTLAVGGNAFVSQHLGDMDAPQTRRAFEQAVVELLDLYDAEPGVLVHDLHPDYATTRWASEVVDAAGNAAQSAVVTGGAGRPAGAVGREVVSRRLRTARLVAVQHHHAHMAACAAENGVEEEVLGVVWDGTGFGTDGTIWGGEFLLGDASGFRRVAHLRPFRLPGADAAVREPRRAALSLLREASDGALGGAQRALLRFTDTELRVLEQLLDEGFRAPLCSSAGRLFDGIAALIGLHPIVSFEGQAAMALEFAADQGAAPGAVDRGYELLVEAASHGSRQTSAPPADETNGPASGQGGAQHLSPAAAGGLQLDWRPLVRAVVADRRRGDAPVAIAARFHHALVAGIVSVARRVGCPTVALSGGCFQNRRLSEATEAALQDEGFRVLVHRRLPPNDGGVSYGQAVVATALLE